MKRAYTNGILLDGTEQMQPVAHKILLTEDDKITAIVDEGVDLDGYEVIDLHGSYIMPGLSICMCIWRATASPAQSRGTMLRWCAKF